MDPRSFRLPSSLCCLKALWQGWGLCPTPHPSLIYPILGKTVALLQFLLWKRQGRVLFWNSSRALRCWPDWLPALVAFALFFCIIASLVRLKQVFFLFLLKILFIYLTESEQAREHKQGERQREKQTPRRAGNPTRDPIPGPRDHDPSQRQTPNQLSHPGAPLSKFSELPTSSFLLVSRDNG